jgi:transglutaminase-like putative cysteine protease
MQLTIKHTTQYEYAEPLLYSIQQLKLTPQDGFGQKVKSWSIQMNGQPHQHIDTYGNVVHTLVVDKNLSEINVTAKGEVETGLGSSEIPEKLPLTIYLRNTHLTQSDTGIADFASSLGNIHSIDGIQKLSEKIVERVPYTKGSTSVFTTASQAFETGHGVCQDHAHIFIACCRSLNIPSRYVSGYLFTEHGDLLESHAWAESWLNDIGWVSVDVSNQCLVNGKHVRLAMGLDYRDACPVSGIRVGGGHESMSVGVDVAQNKPATKHQKAQIQQ